MAKEPDKWMQDVHPKRGALHREMNVPMGQKIPMKRLEKAANAGGKLGKRARLAEVYRASSHKKG